MKKLIVHLTMMAVSCVALGAETWYVDSAIGSDSYDGKAATVGGGHGPFLKIQTAIDAAGTGDTVKLAAGVYGDEQGYVARDASCSAMRVKITKSLTLEGAGREKTVIVGAFDTEKGAAKGYCGANSIGGILIAKDASAAKIKSLTVANCSCSLTTASAVGNSGIGIGFMGSASTALTGKPWIVDCIVSNVYHCNVPVYNVNLARTMVAYSCGVRHTDGNVTSGNGGATYANAIHSVFYNLSDAPRGVATDNFLVGTSAPIMIGNCGAMVNCLFVRNYNAVSPGTICVDKVLNCAVIEHWNASLRANTVSNCVLQTSSGNVKTKSAETNGGNLYEQNGFLAAPTLLDFRPVVKTATVAPDAAAVGQGESAYLELFPEEYRWTDFYGHAFTADANGRICAGCSQDPIVPACAFMTKGVVVDGCPSYCEYRASDSSGWIHVATNDWPRAFELDWDRSKYPTQTDIFNYEVDDGSVLKTPDMSGKAIFVPRKGVRNARVEAMFPNNTYYVDAETGSKGNDGSSSAPLKTIQQAVDKISDTFGVRTLIKVKPGSYLTKDYKNGNTYCSVLVGSTKKCALIGIRSTDGAEKTTIRGDVAPAQYADAFGNGTNATLCVAFFCYTNCFLQGFTLANGHCQATNFNRSSAVWADRDLGSKKFVTVADCIVTNCYGTKEIGILSGVRAVRCKIVDNYNCGKGAFNRTQLVNSLVDGIYDTHPNADKNNMLIDNTPVQGCTLIGRDTNSMTIPSAHTYLFDTISCKTRAFNSNRTYLYYGMVFGLSAGDNGTRFPEGICRRTVTGDPGFADYAACDYHLAASSPAVGWSAWAQLPGYGTPTP